MATSGFPKSRNLLARKRLQQRDTVRKALLEQLEARQLLAVGPQLLGIQPNTGDLIENGDVLNVSPKELTVRFDANSAIDENTLNGIRVIRSGADQVFERASVATDFGTGGQTLVEFFAQEPGEAGNGIDLVFTSRSRNDGRAPVVNVDGRTINIELNANPVQETRVEDILQALDQNVRSAQTDLVYALRLRGSQIAPIARTGAPQTLTLSGANAAKASTNFGISNNLEVRFVARDAGNDGLGVTINVTARDRGGAGFPTVSVVGKRIDIEINSNARFATTVQEFIDALNASDSLSSSLVEAQLVSGIGATRLGSAPITYSPIVLTGVSDIEIVPAFIGLGDTDREVVLRFAETLPDDQYRIEIIGQGTRTLRNVDGEAFNRGDSVSIAFELNLGARVESVVPQPVTRNANGDLQQQGNRIDIYFNDDDLIDVDSITSVNGLTIGQLRDLRQPLYFDQTDTIVGGTDTSVLDVNFYQLFHTSESLDNTDDIRFLPSAIRYYPSTDRVTLTFNRNLDQLVDPNTGAPLAASDLRLRVGSNEDVALPPTTLDANTVDPADTFDAATDLNLNWTPGAGGTQSIVIDSRIDNTSPLLLDFPGGSDEPGNRTNRYQDNLRLQADMIDGTSVIFYNFQDNLGVFSSTNLVNAITEQQKLRVREIFSIYEDFMGVRFVESEALGLTIAVGDMRAIVPFEEILGSGQPGAVELNAPGGTYYEAGALISNGQPGTVLDLQDFSRSDLSEFGGPFQRAAMQAIGRLLGLGLADESGDITIQAFDSAFAPGVGTEIILPGDVDIVHGQYLYRPDSKDIDLYQFALPVDGTISIEAFAERMTESSLLDSQIRLYQQNDLGGWDEIASNDDYYSSDSFLELDLAQGNYIVGVSASGNATYDPNISDSGLGGRSEGDYQLRLDFRPPAQGLLRDGTGVAIDGDADGTPEGVFDFWFRPSGASNTKFVDKTASDGGNGSLAAPFNNIQVALNAAQPGEVVRIVGNGGQDGLLETIEDNVSYEIGFDILGRPLEDGATFDVPQGVSVMIDAGAILKMRRSRVGVGSTTVNVDRSGGSLLVLGTPMLLDAAGNPLENAAGIVPGSVYVTSINDNSVGTVSSSSTIGGVPAQTGDWGGIDFRARIDHAEPNRVSDERQGQFLNWVSHADIRFGGGQVVVDGVSQAVTSIQSIDARPTLVGNMITDGSGAAISATPDSFLESNFHSPAEQGGASFTVDYDRVGPKITGNTLSNNAINGMQILVRQLGNTEVALTVPGRFDDADIVHYLPENLTIMGTPGGAFLANEAPASSAVTSEAQPLGTLAAGTYTYVFTSVDANGVESAPSEPTSAVAVGGQNASVLLSNLPIGINRIYRSTAIGEGPFELIASLTSNSTTFVDSGSTLGTPLATDLAINSARLDARLAIDPGVVLKFNGSRIDVDLGAQLIAEGVPGNPVVFTSIADNRYGAGSTFMTANNAGRNAAAGDWGGLFVGHTSSASLDNVVLAYGGGTTRIEGGFADFNPVEVHQGDLRIANSRIENNANGSDSSTHPTRAGRGINDVGSIFVLGAQPILVDNIFIQNQGPVISANVGSLNSEELVDYGRSTGLGDFKQDKVTNRGPLVIGNRLSDNEFNGLLVRGGQLNTEGWWDDTDIVHIVRDEIQIPDHQHFGGLRLASAPDQSLVVKLTGDTAGFTATGTPLDNVNRIGGSIQLVGQPNYPVVLTSINDNTVGAGFTVDGQVQNNTVDISLLGLLPTIGEVNNGTLIDNDVQAGIPGQFAFNVGPGGASGFGGPAGGGGITAQGRTQLFVNLDVIFEFLNYVDVGANGNALNLQNTTITLPPTLISPDLVASEGNFQGANGLVNWRVESSMPSGQTTVFNTLRFTSAQNLGDLQVINYLDEDISGATDDLLYQVGTPGEADFRAFTLDGPERIGFSQGGVYFPTPNQLENATYEGWAADQFNDLQVAIEGTGTAYTVAGNIDLTDLPPVNDPELGPINGLNDVTTAFAWRVDPNASEAVVTSFLELVPRNPASAVARGDWRSVLLDPNSNDRNVSIVTETESQLSNSTLANETPSQSQYLGELAPNQASGDENRRLGIHLEGVISRPSDVDVYSFHADAGTEVWLDIDDTNSAFDGVIELVDANGRTLALSDSSLAEEADPSLLFAASDLPPQSVNPLRQSAPEFYFESAQGVPKDIHSTNADDPGMRVRLPGEPGSNNLYHVRVRSSNLRDGDPASNLLNGDLTQGITKGSYQLQLRLSEVDEVPGSSVNYADIRFASNGLELVGVPYNSPLLGENGEVEAVGGARNDDFASAQALGNLLETNRQAISISGSIDDRTDVDWFSFDLQYSQITPNVLREYFSTVLDIDYSDGIGRPDTSIYVFNAAGQLILAGLESTLIDDQSGAVTGPDGAADLTRGSFGGLDPYIGPFELPSGRYFVAITNSSQAPAVMAAFTDPNFPDTTMRLQPLESVELIAEDHIERQGGSTALPPRTPILFPTPGDFDGTTFYTSDNDSIVDFDLSDISLYVSRDVGTERTNVYHVNPFTGEVRNQVGQGAFDVHGFDFRPNGELRGFNRTIEANVGNGDADTFSTYINIDPGTGQFVADGNLGTQTTYLDPFDGPPPTVQNADDGVSVEALAFGEILGNERGLVVANRPTLITETELPYFQSARLISQANSGQNGRPTPFPGFARPGITNFTNIIYEIDETTGAAISAPLPDKQGLPIASGAGTAIRERGRIETFTRDPFGRIESQSARIQAREVTTGTLASGANFIIRDGDQVRLIDGSFSTTILEFDLGPQVLVSYDPLQGRNVTDGMQFSLDGQTYEFDTGSVIIINALDGTQLADGSTVRIENESGEVRIFEFDSNSQVIGAGNIAVPFTTASTQLTMVQALVDAINGAGFGVIAQANPNTNRISLLGASLSTPVQITGSGISLDGSVGVSSGAIRIPVSEAASLNEFLFAVARSVTNGVTVGFEAGRMNFSGATTGSFTSLEQAGIFTNLGTDGTVSTGAIPVRVLASDTAETVAARVAQAVNGAGLPILTATFNGTEVRFAGAEAFDAGPLALLGIAPGGLIRGAAIVDEVLFAVSNTGGLFRVDNPTTLTQGNVGRFVETAVDLIGINFTGLVEGPTHVRNGELSRILFGIDAGGRIHAFDTAGRLQPIFANGATSVATGLTGASGITMSSLDFNLWHVDGQRSGDAGHGLPATPNDSRGASGGGQSLYFGFNNPFTNGVPDLTGPDSTGLADSYNFPGGAAGAIESAPFSLAGISATDLPTLYFSYLLNNEGPNGVAGFLTDSLRVYASGADGQWQLLAANNGGEGGQVLFDNNGAWRQARVPLDGFAGEEEVTLRVEFSSHGGFGFGLRGGQGPEIRTVAGDVLADGEQLVIDGRTFEIEIGPTLSVPGSSAITNGEYVVVEGIRYVFTDGSLPVVAPDIPVPYTAGLGANDMAVALQNAIATASIPPRSVSGNAFDNESNDTISTAEFTEITGAQSIVVSGSGEIGDNANLADPATDVDLIRVSLQRGATVTIDVAAASIGSSLDSFLRVFDGFGSPLRNAAGQPIQNNNSGGSSDSSLTFTVPETGTYYIGVSGAGNQAYLATVENTALPASTGFYNLTIAVDKLLNPVVAGNRVQLEGATSASLPDNSPLVLQGQFGSIGTPVFVTLDMSKEEVALALQASVADFFAGGERDVYPVNRNVVDLTGLVDYSSIDPATGLPAPSLTDLDPGPFNATTNFAGDARGSFNASTAFDGTTTPFLPGFLGGQRNDFEGAYLDDFIIGMAGRGEMVMNSSSNTNFINDPFGAGAGEITLGEYQLEVRGGEEYGIPGLAGIALDRTFQFDARMAESTSIRFNDAANMVAGETFVVGDGTRSITFEMDDVNDNIDVQPGNMALPFSTLVQDPITGSTFSESAEAIAARFRDIINSTAVQAILNISANLLNNDRVGSTSPTVALIGNSAAVVPPTIGEVIASELKGGDNRDRAQGQVVINASRISNSLGFGVSITSAPNDVLTGATSPSSPRNLITLNAESLVPGAVIMNSELISNTDGGISITGPTQDGTVPPAATAFVRLVNNTIVGGTINEVTGLEPTVEGGQVFDSGFLAFADNVVSYNPIGGGVPPIPGLDNPIQATGAPNYTGTGEPQINQNVVSLGRGGELVLEFTNNFLTGSGNADPDLMIFEVGDSEEVGVELSVDGVTYIDVGRASGASPTIDIDAFGFSTISRIPFVRLTDLANQGAQSGDSVGADIDAVGAISSVAADILTPGGQGVVISNNATATLLNNVVVNTATGISVDVSSDNTVIGGTVFQNNQANVAGSATLGQFPADLEPNIPIFVSPGSGNFYPSPSSPVIDASIDTLADRPSLFAVKQPLGIPGSPILAPTFDINGQLRINDPLVEAPAGLGGNVFKDRGSQDRGDFVGPSVVLQNPLDNDNAGLDANPDTTIVELTNISLNHFDLRLIDGIAPSDPTPGTGIDHRSVTSATVLLFRNDVPLVEGLDYNFGYDSTNGVIRLTPLAGVWQEESVYTIRFVNSTESSIVASAGSGYTDGEQFRILDITGSQTTFEAELGYLINIPTVDGTAAELVDGTTFQLDDGFRVLTFELDTNGATTPGNVAVSIGGTPSIASAALGISQALLAAGYDATLSNNRVQVQSSTPLTITDDNTGLLISGATGVQTVFGLQIPLMAGVPEGLVDGQTFTIDRSGAPVTFELDTNGSVLAGNVPVQFSVNSSADQIGAALVTAIDGANIGLSPSYDGGGLVRLGGDRNTGLDLSNTVLTQTGVPGELASVPVEIPVGASSIEVARILKAAIEGQNLPGVTVTQFGARLVVGNIQGISGTGANQIGPIRDMAGNPLKPNQDDGTTLLSIFMGEGFDYGDLGNPYTSTAAQGGPRHTVVTGLSLGNTVTVDADAKLVDADSDDGVVFSDLFAAFQGDVTLNVTNTTGNSAFASVWVDFDGDGVFEDTERVYGPNAVNASTTVSFLVPSDAMTGQTGARIRLSSDQAAISSPIGDAIDGEVEDYVITIGTNPFTSPLNRFDVNGDGFVSPIDALQVIRELDLNGGGQLFLPAPNAPPYFDVDGNGFLTPRDGIELIDYLNNLAGNGEGEFAGALGSADIQLDFGSEHTVLASDWAGGLENLVVERRSHRSTEQSIVDSALMDSDADLSFASGLNWSDAEEEEGDEDLYGDLADELL